jgi:hypothetical protein
MTTYKHPLQKRVFPFGRNVEMSNIGADVVKETARFSLSPVSWVKLVYDFAVDGPIAATSGKVPLRVAGSDEQFILPAGFQITTAFKRVTQTFTSATDAAAIGLGLYAVDGSGDDDAAGIVAALAISNGSNIWDATAKVVATIQTGTAGNASEETTEDQYLSIINTAGEANTAGRVIVYAEILQLD